MAKQVINIGATPNDGNGDPIRTAFDKTNDNFTEVYTEKLSTVSTDATITGDGTTATPLSAVQQDISGIATNASDIANIQGEQITQDAAIALNTAKVGITPAQAADITANNAKISYTDSGVVSQNTTDIGNNTTAIGLKADKATLTQSGGNVTGSIDTSANTFTLTSSGGGGGAVDSVNGETGVVVLDGTEIELIENGGVSVTQSITDLSNASLQDVTDNGNSTTNPIVTPSINGAAITSAGAGGVLYLDDKGVYTAPPSGGGGEINTASNVGSGAGVFKQKNQSDLQFKSFQSAGSALSVASGANDVTYTLNDAAFATAAQGAKADSALQSLDVSIRTIAGTTDTLVLTDANKYLRCTNAASVTETVPPNSSVAFTTGTVITMRQAGAGQVTLAAGAGVTLNGNLNTAEQHASIQIVKVDTDVWDVTGGIA